MLVNVKPLKGKLSEIKPLKGKLNRDIEYVSPSTQEKVVEPSQEQQIVVPDDGVFALSKVTVEPIPDNYVDKSGLEINDASYLFYNRARLDKLNELCSLISSKNKTYYYAFYNCSNLTEIPKLNTSEATNFDYMFNNCQALVSIPPIDISNANSIDYMFANCYVLSELPINTLGKTDDLSRTFLQCRALTQIPQFDTSKIKYWNSAFQGCKSITELPQFDTSVGIDFNSAFRECESLLTIPKLNMSNANSVYYMLYYDRKLENLGGFENLGQGYSITASANNNNCRLDLMDSNNLTHESLMNVINNLYDIATKGCNPQNLKLGATNLAKLTEEEIAIATNKGWNVTT